MKEITKEQFESYLKVQQSGMFNMVMDARAAASMAGLDLKTYFEIIKNYSYLMKKFF